MPFHIKPLKDQARQHFPFNNSIPAPIEGGFRLGVFAASGGGKSVLLLNLLKEYRRYFKKVIVWSFNLRQYRRHFGKLMTKHDILYTEYKEPDLRHHFQKAVARNVKRPKRITPVLMIFDDMLSVISKSPYFMEIMLTARKENVSIIFTAHKYTFAPPIIRQNLTHTILMTTNRIELRTLAAYLGFEGDDLIKAWHDSGAEKKFAFLYFTHDPASAYFKFTDKKLLG